MIAHRLRDKWAREEPITIENFVIDTIKMDNHVWGYPRAMITPGESRNISSQFMLRKVGNGYEAWQTLKEQIRYQDLWWKVHHSAQSFVLLSYTMHELRNKKRFHWFLLRLEVNNYSALLSFVHGQGQKIQQTIPFGQLRVHEKPDNFILLRCFLSSKDKFVSSKMTSVLHVPSAYREDKGSNVC